MKKICITIAIISLSAHLYCQQDEDELSATHGNTSSPFFIIDGYIKSEAYYDNRQIFGALASQELLFPLDKELDPTGSDINAHGQGQFVPFESRVRLGMVGLKTKDATITAVIETDFEGKEDSGTQEFYFNLFRMRHAYVRLDWNHFSFLCGQTWHPTTIEEVSPQTVSFNSGRPIEQYTRSPQFTFMNHTEHSTFLAVATSEVDFVSYGPDGASSEYMRFAIVPNLHAQIRAFWSDHIAGFGIDYKRLTPRLQSSPTLQAPLGYQVREHINSVAALWFAGFNWPYVQVRSKIMWGQNVADRDTIGGYAVKKGTINPITGQQEYTNIRTITLWSDVAISRFRHAEPAFFIGVAKNLGAARPIELNPADPTATVFGLGTNINTIFRVSPRVRFMIKKIVFALEYEYTRATYGTINDKGNVVDTHPVANNRVLFATLYYF